MIQQLIIAFAVAVAALYLVWSFAGPQRRQRGLDALARRGLLQGWAARHRARLLASGCEHCSASSRHAALRSPRP